MNQGPSYLKFSKPITLKVFLSSLNSTHLLSLDKKRAQGLFQEKLVEPKSHAALFSNSKKGKKITTIILNSKVEEF